MSVSKLKEYIFPEPNEITIAERISGRELLPLEILCFQNIMNNLDFHFDKYYSDNFKLISPAEALEKHIKIKGSRLKPMFHFIPDKLFDLIHDFYMKHYDGDMQKSFDLFLVEDSRMNIISLEDFNYENASRLLYTFKYKYNEYIIDLSLKNCMANTSHINNALPSLKLLVKLDLTKSQIDDETFAIVALHMNNLRDLFANYTNITDRGLENLLLGEHKPIRTLKIWDTRVTNEGVLNLLKIYPELTVLHGGGRTTDTGYTSYWQVISSSDSNNKITHKINMSISSEGLDDFYEI